MNYEIFYFTGTGNSQYTARRLAELLGGETRSIARIMQAISNHDFGPNIIIVFPSYLAMVYGVPVIVKEFAERIPEPASKRIILVCSCGGYEMVNAVPSVLFLEGVIRAAGGRVFSSHTLRMPMNNLDYDHIPVPIERDEVIILERAEQRIIEIAGDISRSRQRIFKRLAAGLIMFLMKPMFSLLKKAGYNSMLEIACEAEDCDKPVEAVFRSTDRSISADGNCNGCGICVSVCPVGNISLSEGSPVWNHACEMCFACHEWCPRKAVHHWGRKDGVYYRHPKVGIKDMIAEKPRIKKIEED